MSNAARVARNTIWNWVGVVVSTLVVVLLTPYLVNRLGDERFGVYAIANQVLTYVNLLALGAPGALTRFASKEIAANDVAGLNLTLSVVGLFYLIIGGVGIVVCGLLGTAAPAFFGITPSYTAETRFLFLAVGCNFLLVLWGLMYGSVLMGHQRYDLLNLGNIVRDLSRGGLVVLIFTLGWVTLGGLATALVSAHVAGVACFRYAAHRRQPGLRIRPKLAGGEVTRRILGFSAWNGLIQIGNAITFATPIFIVGKVLGPEHVVFYAVPFMMADRLRVAVTGMANTLAPIAAATLVTGDREHLRTLLIKGTRAAATLSFSVGGVLLVFCEPLLCLWMGVDYGRAWVVYAVLMIGMFGRISQTSTMRVLLGGGSIRALAYIQIASAVAAVALAVSLVVWTSWGVVGVAAGVAAPLFVGHTIVLPCCAASQMNLSVWRYGRLSYLWPMLSTLPGIGVALLLRSMWPPTGWFPLILEFMLSLGVIAVLAWYTCLDAALRRRVLQTLGVR